MKAKRLTKKDQELRKYKKYNILKSYLCDKGTNKIDVSKITYDKYKVCSYNDGILEEIDVAKQDGTLLFDAPKKGEYVLYGADKNRLLGLMIALAFIIMILVARAAYANIPEFRDMVNTIFSTTEEPTAPKIVVTNDNWAKETLVKVVKNAESDDGIDHYEYCLREDMDFSKCNWKKTKTKSMIATKNGKYFVVFRGVSKKNKEGKISNIAIVLIDNEAPTIESIKRTGDRVEVVANDKYSGVDKIEYKIDDSEYKVVNKSFRLPQGKYKLTIRVVDKAGNITEVEQEINLIPEEIENNEKENETKTEESKKASDKEKEEEQTEKLLPPKIDLDDVPTQFERGDEYILPSHYEFDDLGGNVSCEIETHEVVTNTKDIAAGQHTITCKAEGNNGLTTTVSKDVTITEGQKLGILDGWITMNLYYPENATDMEWMIKDPTVLRTGYQKDTWMPYTGPITVKLSDVENVYIRYKIQGQTVIIAPNGKLVVDIQPTDYSLKTGQKTKVIITYEAGAQTKEYRIDNGPWMDYVGQFEVGPNTKIEARVIKDVNVYDSNGNFVNTIKKQSTDAVYISEYIPATTTPSNPGTPRTTSTGSQYIYTQQPNGTWVSTPYSPSGPARPSTYLEGPEITSNPNTGIAEKTNVIVTPQQTASKIYISIDGGKWTEYTGPVEVTKNCIVSAYYVRASDGLRSATTYYDVNNIAVPTLPYVKITASPSNYLSVTQTSVNVQISGSNYDRLEYSFDGTNFLPYTTPLTITTSSTVYARGINSNGDTIVSKTITTVKPSIPWQDLSVAIHFDPEKTQVQGLINKAKVTIDYDNRAEKKYYRIGYYGQAQAYTGPFDMTTNDTVYAWATNSNGYGETQRGIDYLTLGIGAPVISTLVQDGAPTIPVEITYAKNADVKQYKIDNGPWIDYTGKFYVTTNCTIYAKNSDVLGNTNQSSRTIRDIVVTYKQNYTVVKTTKVNTYLAEGEATIERLEELFKKYGLMN